MKSSFAILPLVLLLASSSDGVAVPSTEPPADLRVDALLGDIRWGTSGSGENRYTPGNRPCSSFQTAYGQVFFHHRWPATAIEPVEDTNPGTGATATTMGGPYDWDAMAPGPVSPEEDEAQAEARGELIWDIGVCLSVRYWETGSRPSSMSDGQLPVQRFRYANVRTFRNASFSSAITNALCCSLDAGFPCIGMNGTDRAVVLDGYGFGDGDLWFHVNLGRAGDGDGWYRQSVLFGSGGELPVQQVSYNLFPDKTGEIVSGRVFDDAGSPLPGVAVTLRSEDGSFSAESAPSNSNGVWAVAGVPSGTTLAATAFLPWFSFEPQTVQTGTSREQTLLPQHCGNRWGVDFAGTPAEAATVSGTVLTPAGKPLCGILVEATGAGSVLTDADGRYGFEVPDGWSGTVAPAAGQGLVSPEPASHAVGPIRAGTRAQCDFTATAVFFVDASAQGAGDGTSWPDAFPGLADALASSAAGREIWVAAGTYKPTEGTSRAIPFVVPAGVSVYGGFDGTETARDERDWIANATVLSGEIGDPETAADNTPVLVVGSKDAVLDGFTVTGARMNAGESSAGFGFADDRWAGVVCAVHGTDDSSPFDFRVEHCLVRGNRFGAALAKGWVLFVSCVFEDNAQTSDYSSVFLGCSVQNCTFWRTRATYFSEPSRKESEYPFAHVRNCYFGDSYGGQFFYRRDHDKRPWMDFNLHPTSAGLSGTTNGTVLVFAVERLSADPATPSMPPMDSAARDAGTTESGSASLAGAGLSAGWETSATDYLGNPRLHGSSIDIGAYELDPALVRYPPNGTVSVSDVTTNSAVATVTVTSMGTASSVSAVLVCRSTNPVGDDRTVDLGVFGEPGSKSVLLSGLGPWVSYNAEAVLSGDGTEKTLGAGFRTLATDPPVVRSVWARAGSYQSCIVQVDVETFGERSGGGSIGVSVYANAGFEGEPVATHGSDGYPEKPPALRTFLISGLSAGTTYYVKVVVRSNNGLSVVDTSQSFATPSEIPPKGTFSVGNVARTTAEAVFSLSELGNFSTGALLRVQFAPEDRVAAGYRSVEIGPLSSAPGSRSAVLAGLAPGTRHAALGYLVSLPSGLTVGYPFHASFTTQSAPAADWFDVRWNEDGYAAGADWCVPEAAAASGGEWTRPEGDVSSLSDGRLALELPDGGRLRFAASRPSAVQSAVAVEGVLAPVPGADPPDAAGAFAGLAFTESGLRAWNGSGWISLDGDPPAAGEEVSWKALFDFTAQKPSVKFVIGEAALQTVVVLGTDRNALSGVEYAGGGTLGDFRATCSGGFFEPVFAAPAGGGGTSFGGTDGNPAFGFAVGNAAAEAWYTLYESDAVGGPYRAVRSVRADADGVLPFSVDASAPARFFRVGASDAEVLPGAEPAPPSPSAAAPSVSGAADAGNATAVFFR